MQDKDKIIRKLRKALEDIAEWRDAAHSYDREMDCEPRDFCEEDVEQIETFAKHHLESAFPSENK